MFISHFNGIHLTDEFMYTFQSWIVGTPYTQYTKTFCHNYIAVDLHRPLCIGSVRQSSKHLIIRSLIIGLFWVQFPSFFESQVFLSCRSSCSVSCKRSNSNLRRSAQNLCAVTHILYLSLFDHVDECLTQTMSEVVEVIHRKIVATLATVASMTP